MTNQDEVPITHFAPAERAPQEKLKSDVLYFSDIPMIQCFVDLIPDVFLILNKERQIVYSNKTLLTILGIDSPDSIYGLRPGEALNCVHSHDPGGCGTSEFCRYCGAVNAILNSQKSDKTAIEECRIIAGDENEQTAFDFRVWAKTITINSTPYTLFVVRDISNEKRRSVLEKTFFHDILNTAGGIQGVAALLEEADEMELEELVKLVESASGSLIDEIRAQKDLLAAESGTLSLEITKINSHDLLNSIHDIYLKHDVAEGKEIAIHETSESLELSTDARLLKRIIGNMLKNALEASEPGDTVTMLSQKDGDKAIFSVKNSAVMPDEVKLQFFQRSFSTKGSGRGIGTYSIKLFGEKYLKGKVSFESKAPEGTTVRIALPLEWDH